MAVVLIRMKLAILRHSMSGAQATWMVTGGLVGLVLAAGTILLSALPFQHPSAVGDLLAVTYAIWLLGWIIGPIIVGGDSVLRAEHFALLPISRVRLAIGLLGAAFVGVGAAVTLLAFVSLVFYASRLGAIPSLVAIVALILQLVLVILLSRVATHVFGGVMKSRAGAALTAVLFAGALVLVQSGWELLVALLVSGVLDTGFSPPLSTIIRALPSGWGLVAVEAAYRSDWLLVATALVGLVVVIAILLVVWGWLLVLPRTAWVTVRGSRGPAETSQLVLRRVGLSSGTAAVVVKELHSWWRDPTRTMAYVLALAWALMTCLLPLTLSPLTSLATILLPWAGPAILLIAPSVTSNLYGQDGTALWLTVLTPGAARHDVRGRQWAWLIVFVPMTLVITILLTALSGQTWAWPWVVAIVPALLGGGVGLSLWASVVALAPGPDPHRAKGSQLERPASSMAYVLFWLALLPAVPALTIVLAGTLLHNDALRWAGVPVGMGTGAFLACWLGAVAYRRLEARGPELLSLMRFGSSSTAKAVEARPGVVSTMSQWQRTRFTTLYPVLGAIALFPQGIVPLIDKLSGGHVRSWFLALYLPEVWQWPTIMLMILIGLGCYGAMLHLYWTQKQNGQQLQAEQVNVTSERTVG